MFTLFLNLLFVNADNLIETQGFIFKRNLFWTDICYTLGEFNDDHCQSVCVYNIFFYRQTY